MEVSAFMQITNWWTNNLNIDQEFFHREIYTVQYWYVMVENDKNHRDFRYFFSKSQWLKLEGKNK